MRTGVVGAAVLLCGLYSCQYQGKNVSRNTLEGTWEFLGFWKDDQPHLDTINVYFTDDDTVLLSRTRCDVVTDDGIRRVTVSGNEAVASEANPYIAVISFESATTGTIRDSSHTHYFDPPLRIKLSPDHSHVFADALVDTETMDTVARASTGMIRFITDDVIQVEWDHGAASRFRKVGSIP